MVQTLLTMYLLMMCTLRLSSNTNLYHPKNIPLIHTINFWLIVCIDVHFRLVLCIWLNTSGFSMKSCDVILLSKVWWLSILFLFFVNGSVQANYIRFHNRVHTHTQNNTFIKVWMLFGFRPNFFLTFDKTQHVTSVF